MRISVLFILLFSIINVSCMDSHHVFIDNVETSEGHEVTEEPCLEEALLEDFSPEFVVQVLAHNIYFKDFIQYSKTIPLEITSPPPDLV